MNGSGLPKERDRAEVHERVAIENAQANLDQIALHFSVFWSLVRHQQIL